MINIKPLLVELSHTDVKALLKGLKNESKILREWNELILELNKIAGKLAKGEKLGNELHHLRGVTKSFSVAELGSMLPGPIRYRLLISLGYSLLVSSIRCNWVCFESYGVYPLLKNGFKIIEANIEKFDKRSTE